MAITKPAARTQSERREQTRVRLVDATIACLAEHGYRATTTRRVAQTAGVSLGALSHQFASRLDLIASTLDEVGQRGAEQLRVHVGDIGDEGTERLLNVLWAYFHGELFTVWIKVWLAAAEDEALYARLAPIEHRLNTTLASIAADARPETIAPGAWTRRLSVALHALRGLALQLAIEPRESAPTTDPWPATREELTAMIDRP
jgi:AcrR family transcriptional regulator